MTDADRGTMGANSKNVKRRLVEKRNQAFTQVENWRGKVNEFYKRDVKKKAPDIVREAIYRQQQ